MATVTIEIDQTTAAILQAKAAIQGMSLEMLLRNLTANGIATTGGASSPTSLEQFMADMESLSEGTEKALVADLVPASVRGRAFGWMNGLIGFAALPASVGFGFLWQQAGSRTAFLTGAAIAAIAAAGLLVLRFPHTRPAG